MQTQRRGSVLTGVLQLFSQAGVDVEVCLQTLMSVIKKKTFTRKASSQEQLSFSPF